MSANAALYDFMIGEWTVEFQRLPEETKVGHRAIVKLDWFLDGTAILDESGMVNFRGATFHTYLQTRTRGTCSG